MFWSKIGLGSVIFEATWVDIVWTLEHGRESQDRRCIEAAPLDLAPACQMMATAQLTARRASAHVCDGGEKMASANALRWLYFPANYLWMTDISITVMMKNGQFHPEEA